MLTAVQHRAAGQPRRHGRFNAATAFTDQAHRHTARPVGEGQGHRLTPAASKAIRVWLTRDGVRLHADDLAALGLHLGAVAGRLLVLLDRRLVHLGGGTSSERL